MIPDFYAAPDSPAVPFGIIAARALELCEERSGEFAAVSLSGGGDGDDRDDKPLLPLIWGDV